MEHIIQKSFVLFVCARSSLPLRRTPHVCMLLPSAHVHVISTISHTSNNLTKSKQTHAHPGEIERTVEVKGWGGHVRVRSFVPDDGGVPSFIVSKKRDLFTPSYGSKEFSGEASTIVDISSNAKAVSPLGARASATGFLGQSPDLAKTAYMKNSNPSNKDHHELSHYLVTDWIYQTIPEAQQVIFVLRRELLTFFGQSYSYFWLVLFLFLRVWYRMNSFRYDVKQIGKGVELRTSDIFGS